MHNIPNIGGSMMKHNKKHISSRDVLFRCRATVITRRDFIKVTGASILAVGTVGCNPLQAVENPTPTNQMTLTGASTATVPPVTALPTKNPTPTIPAPSPTPQPAQDASPCKRGVRQDDRPRRGCPARSEPSGHQPGGWENCAAQAQFQQR